MQDTEKLTHILSYRNRPDLAKAIRGCSYKLNMSSTYGSRWHSMLTSVELYAPIQKHELLQNLTEEDKEEIIRAFHVLYPVREDDMEIHSIEFLIDPDAPIPMSPRKALHLDDIDYVYITEQVEKCDSKIASGDFEGAITNARNLIESICKYILDDSDSEYDAKADLPALYKETTKLLNMHPSQHIETAFKQILSGCFSIVQGFATVRNELSDAHGKSTKKHYKADERHAMFVVGAAKALADFMYASFNEKKKLPNNEVQPTS
jgi:hypothetical protein